MSIGKKLELLRKSRNLTQEELAEIVNVSRQTIYKWEQDYAIPSYPRLKIIVEYFEITYDDILSESHTLELVIQSTKE